MLETIKREPCRITSTDIPIIETTSSSCHEPVAMILGPVYSITIWPKSGHLLVDWTSLVTMYRPVDVVVPISAEELLMMRAPVWTTYGEAAHTAVTTARFIGERAWCGSCMSHTRLVCVDGCATMIEKNTWCRGCVGVPKEFCGVSCWRERLLSSMSYVAFYDRVLELGAEQLETMNPCSWCAMGAGSWCESCDRSMGPANSLCNRCDDNLKACRLCYADNYVRKAGRVRVPPDAARQDSRVCAHCGLSARMKCGSCKVVNYCSTDCQAQDWNHHKPVCSMLRKAIPVYWVYRWHAPIVDILRNYANMAGNRALTRFYACFGAD